MKEIEKFFFSSEWRVNLSHEITYQDFFSLGPSSKTWHSENPTPHFIITTREDDFWRDNGRKCRCEMQQQSAKLIHCDASLTLLSATGWILSIPSHSQVSRTRRTAEKNVHSHSNDNDDYFVIKKRMERIVIKF